MARVARVAWHTKMSRLLAGGMIAMSLGSQPVLALNFADPSSIAEPLVKTFGLSEDHRAYDPASPIGQKLDLGMEVTLVKFPSDVSSLIGLSFPVLAAAKLHVRRGITERVDVGVSGLYLPPLPFLQNMSILNIGGDIKGIVWLQPEGPTLALRASYSYFKFSYPIPGVAPLTSTLDLYTHTITPQIVLSKKMGVVDPYIGVGYQIVLGGITSTTSFAPQPIADVVLSYPGSAYGFLSFIGLKFDLKLVTLVLEGEYGQNDTPALGMKLGFSF